MRRAAAVAVLLLSPAATFAGELDGPARFCGYSPIIDLLVGERIVTLEGGIHGGTFRWTGAFGALQVYGSGWASSPRGTRAKSPTSKGHILFAPRRSNGAYTATLWNRRQGAAYFSSPKPLTREQMAAIERVALFQEGEDPEGCDLRTIFSWE